MFDPVLYFEQDELKERIKMLQEITSESKRRTAKACIACEGTYDVFMESSRTCYPFSGDPYSDDNPNKPIPLCSLCAIEHHQYWDEMWAEVYGKY